jgi:GNAT superfamily N-acetyltransferase
MSLMVAPAELARRRAVEDLDYDQVGRAHVLLLKAAQAPVAAPVLHGRLIVSKSGWALLTVPNALARGLFDAMNEPGIELPPGHEGGPFAAHVSVMDADEVGKIGGPGKLTERGHPFTYQLGPIQSVEPKGWSEMSRAWFVKVISPELKALRKSYGLTPLPNGDHEFHCTIAVRRKNVLGQGPVSKAAADKFDDAQEDDEPADGGKVKARIPLAMLRITQTTIVVPRPGEGDDGDDPLAAFMDQIRRRCTGADEKRADLRQDLAPVLAGAGLGGLAGHLVGTIRGAENPWRDALWGAGLGGLAGGGASYYSRTHPPVPSGPVAPPGPGGPSGPVAPQRTGNLAENIEHYYKDAPGGFEGAAARAEARQQPYGPRVGMVPWRRQDLDVKVPITTLTPAQARADLNWSGGHGGTLRGWAESDQRALRDPAQPPARIKLIRSPGGGVDPNIEEHELGHAGLKFAPMAREIRGGGPVSRVDEKALDEGDRLVRALGGTPSPELMADEFRRYATSGDELDVRLAQIKRFFVQAHPHRDVTTPDEAREAMDWFRDWIKTREGARAGTTGQNWEQIFRLPDWSRTLEGAAARRMPGLVRTPAAASASKAAADGGLQDILAGWKPPEPNPYAGFEGFAQSYRPQTPREQLLAGLGRAALIAAPPLALAGGLALGRSRPAPPPAPPAPIRRRKRPAVKAAAVSDVLNAAYAQLPRIRVPDTAVGAGVGALGGLGLDALWGARPGESRWRKRLGRVLAGAGAGALAGNVVGDRARRYISNSFVPFGYENDAVKALRPRSFSHVWNAAILDKPQYGVSNREGLERLSGHGTQANAAAADDAYRKDTLENYILPARREIFRRQLGVHTADPAKDLWVEGPNDQLSLNPANPRAVAAAQRFMGTPNAGIPGEMFGGEAGAAKLIDRMNAGKTKGPLFETAVVGGQQIPYRKTPGGLEGSVLDRWDYTLDPKEDVFFRENWKNMRDPAWRKQPFAPAEPLSGYFRKGDFPDNAAAWRALAGRKVLDDYVSYKHPWITQRFRVEPDPTPRRPRPSYDSRPQPTHQLQMLTPEGGPLGGPITSESNEDFLRQPIAKEGAAADDVSGPPAPEPPPALAPPPATAAPPSGPLAPKKPATLGAQLRVGIRAAAPTLQANKLLAPMNAPGRPPFPYGSQHEALGRIGEIMNADPAAATLLTNRLHGLMPRLATRAAAMQQGYQPGPWMESTPANQALLGRTLPYQAPRVWSSPGLGSQYNRLSGLTNLAPPSTDPGVALDATGIARHEFEHALQTSPAQQAASRARDASLDLGDVMRNAKKMEWAAETPASLGDIPYMAEQHRLQTGKPLDTKALLVPGRYEPNAAWMARQAKQHGFFEGRSTTELLDTPSGRAWLKMLLEQERASIPPEAPARPMKRPVRPPPGGFKKGAADDAPGLPAKDNLGPFDRLRVGQMLDYIVQRHEADRAGLHHDIRFGNPELGLLSWAARKGVPAPGEKHLAVRQPVHRHGYKDFEGTIPEGYGKGTVTKHDEGQVLITKVTPESVHFTTAHGRYPERFTLARPKGWDRNWLLMNTTPRDQVPYEKVHYKKIAPEHVEPALRAMQEGDTAEAKVDGASSLIRLAKGHAEALSYRTSKETGRPIIHTERLFGGRPEIKVPRHLEGSVLKGEMYAAHRDQPGAGPAPAGPGEPGMPAVAGGRAGGDAAAPAPGGDRPAPVRTTPQDVGTLLNSGVARSLRLQEERGLSLKNMLYDVQRYGGKDVDPAVTPRAERRKMLEEIAAHLPPDKFHVSEEVRGPEAATKLWDMIRTGQHPLTEEGLVIHPRVGVPSKAKLTEEHDVHLTGTFPGLGKRQSTVGGFTYGHEPGKTVGKVGTGFSDATLAEIARDPSAYVGRVARLKAQQKLPSGALRAPVFLGLHEDTNATPKSASYTSPDSHPPIPPADEGEEPVPAPVAGRRRPRRPPSWWDDVRGTLWGKDQAVIPEVIKQVEEDVEKQGAAHPALADLKRAKAESDRRNYAAKNKILSKLLDRHRGEFVVDSRKGRFFGLTHKQTGFRIHAPVVMVGSRAKMEKAAMNDWYARMGRDDNASSATGIPSRRPEESNHAGLRTDAVGPDPPGDDAGGSAAATAAVGVGQPRGRAAADGVEPRDLHDPLPAVRGHAGVLGEHDRRAVRARSDQPLGVLRAAHVPLLHPGVRQDPLRGGGAATKSAAAVTPPVAYSRSRDEDDEQPLDRIDAHIGGRNVGYLTSHPSTEGDGTWLKGLKVAPRARGQGIGAELMRRVIAEHGDRTLRLRPRPYAGGPLDKDRLAAWYGGMGFVPYDAEGRMVRHPEKRADIEDLLRRIGPAVAVEGVGTGIDTIGNAINNPDHPWTSAGRALSTGLGTVGGTALGAYLGGQYGPGQGLGPHTSEVGGAIAGALAGGVGGTALGRWLIPGAAPAETEEERKRRLALAIQKQADLLPWVSLQPQQRRVARKVRQGQNLLVYHGLGTGKSLASIAAAEGVGGPYTAVVPASLRPNYQGEIKKFTTGTTPAEVLSYTGVGMGKQPARTPETVIMDEVQRIRNPESEGSRAAMDLAMKAPHKVLLSGTPIVNEPSDLAVPLSILTGQRTSPAEFNRKFVGAETVRPGLWGWLQGVGAAKTPRIQNEEDLERMLEGHVDYQPAKTPAGVKTNDERVEVDLGPEQQEFYKLMWGKLPWMMRWKMSNDYPMTKQELAHLTSFMSGPRQAALSLYPFHASKDPMHAFRTSSKLQAAMGGLKETLARDPRAKALVYSNFIDAGLVPYAAALKHARIPFGQFHGSMNDEDRKRALDDYNAGRSRVLLLGPAAAEGISAKGTQLIQLLDPHWNEARLGQARGRGLRFDSHEGLPEELRNVRIQRFVAKMPQPGFFGRLLGAKPRPSADEVLEQQSRRKEELNEQFREVLRRVGSPGYKRPWHLFG